MNRTKLKKTKAPGGQKNISSFFSSQNRPEDLSSSTKLSITGKALAKTELHIRDGDTSKFRPHSPLKRSILGDLENFLPSSPDLLLSVPETPKSQIRDPDQQLSREVVSPEKFGQLSPICRSPRSKGQSVRRVMTGDGRRTKREEGCSVSIKRLISPPQESHNVKRQKTVNPLVQRTVLSPTGGNLNVTKPVKIPDFSSDQSKDHSRGTGVVFNENKHKSETDFSGDQEKHQEEKDSAFTVITEQKAAEAKASGNSHTHLDEDTHTLTAHVHKPNAQNVTPAMQRSEKDGEIELNVKGEMRTTMTPPNGDRGSVTSSDQDRAGGTTSACDVDEGLDESWFTEQMDDKHLVTEDKFKKPRKVPEHVILSGGLNNRYWVLDVEERPGLKTLTISCSKSLHPIETCLLKDGWEMTPVCRGDVVHLEGHSDGGSWLVNREQGFLVLLPDSLISGTSISSSIRCMRRAVLGDMFKSFDGGSKQMLNGTMVHEVFQRAATAKDFSLETLSKLADQALHSPQYLGDMYSLGVTQEEMKQELHDYLPSLELWAREYLSSPTPKAISLKIPSNSRAPSPVVTVTELADIEENVWSPRFGLKGKIDVTARVRIQRPRNGGHRTPEERTVPLELKTGRESNSIEHRSQVILYTLMSLERYNPEAGFLLYLKTGNMHPVVPSHMDRRELLKLRNTLVHHIHNCVEKEAGRSHLSRLPDILTNRQTCQYCPQKRNCALYERALDGSSAEDSEDVVRDFLQQETGHLTPPHLRYFSHWLLLCCLEAATMEAKNGRKRVWLRTPEESEKNGSCVGNVQLSGPVMVQSGGVFLHRFQRSNAVPQKSLTNSGLASGDRIVVSDQEGHLVGLATGYLCEVSRTLISCTLDRDLSKFTGVLFRLDSDEGVVGLSTHLTNLSKLMVHCQDSDRLRELVVDLRPPDFISNLSSVLPREAKDTVANILKGLNKPQKQAMKKVLLSKDYTLIVGMPGTGKTTTICTLVRILHACGFSVLLTSYTHSAVDNILLKLKCFRVGFLRLGQGQKVHPDILPYTEESLRKKGVHTLSELEQLYNKELVVGTTCMGIKHPIFTRRRFDFCIIDEASQISQPICLGPLFYAKRFVLVGDHQQLPPIVQNQEAKSLGMDESLFKRLELHGDAVVQLNVQYRMNRQIMSLSNSLMYEGRLECGSERTATALLTLPFLLSVQSELSSYSKTDPQHDLAWLQATLLPSNPVCFLDCSMVPALESVEQGGISNHTEAVLIHKLLSLLIKAGCKPSDIGVIAPYRQQLKTISALLQSSAFTGVEVNTVDRYQGRDKSLIILSFVRSTTEEGTLGELLKDWRRLNVAITRAKHKLLMVGSATTLRRYAPVEKLLNHLQQVNMMIQLPPAAHNALPSISL
ncbi:DNA replication ATP-dependent helicase/nuclease DNA2 isoform X3 [Larimichthys crocea]|uniref:DNA replication ATP-dependent helicase/nuclease DNA2 isoform X1 n=1 Tax=Larimichthys crocea TaxID=215358 RepID=UPI000F5D6990|nr:DNA replication ATP-dependent helicase/nuclease DNA2 isoform X1 [Larimichthys crocea]XP_019109383.2 DNA replication ATP-dependent helicase/nuclease DNA2 isoform X2 [Larimichthys crocea]XP_027137577.1 DNA replication ATP-dependent helicase/nuclease DNA2 isoform X3 [Larimichthys crocea]